MEVPPQLPTLAIKAMSVILVLGYIWAWRVGMAKLAYEGLWFVPDETFHEIITNQRSPE
jgi:hypothetical protein